ncbi:hypothetical protein SCP_0313440 [Sparassis crispa]|uniref:F-box domain-containing protein n=1 Tax=Sparassis crispa TaxID=139825 RepID=A0A401GHM2_9APHY|nr:hypothetical protein SCP_0313440 [Sparassis crispa]GBE81615.1 hypothetical protein SCP_0313440 [Sparassis crispa]
MSLLSLNYDVLALVLRQLSPADARQLALTSQQLYELASRRALARVTLGGAFYSSRPAIHQLIRFCTAILARPAHLPFLLHLEVMRDAVRRRIRGAWAVDPACVRVLAEVIARASRLNEITLWGADALFVAHPPIIDALKGLPALRTVTLGGALPPLPALARAFPHLRTLHLVDGGSCAPRDSALATDDAHTPASAGWTALDSVDAAHAVLPLACPVRRLALRDPLHPRAPERARAALTLLARTRPVVLSCALDVSLDSAAFAARLPAAAPALRFLEIELYGCESEKDARAWMTALAPALAPLALRGLALRRHATQPRSAPPTPLCTPLPSRAPSPAADPDALARALVRALPVQFLALQPADGGAGEALEGAWFEAVGRARAERMHEEEGRRVARWLRALDRYD